MAYLTTLSPAKVTYSVILPHTDIKRFKCTLYLIFSMVLKTKAKERFECFHVFKEPISQHLH